MLRATLCRCTCLMILGAASCAAAQVGMPRPAITPQGSAPVAAGQSATAGAAVQGSTGTVDSNTYILSPGDTIQVTTFKEPTLSGSFPIRPDGMISLSLVGDIRAAGSTPTQLGEAITDKLGKYIQQPNVTVSVLSVMGKEIFFLGEAAHVGPVALFPGMTPLQAIAAAGGLSPYANSKKIYILRTVAGKQQKIPFNYKKALSSGDQQGVQLMPGDTIVVP